jgi:hypothetical protein
MSRLAVKVKVNFNLEQAIEAPEEERYSYTLSLTSAMDGGG